VIKSELSLEVSQALKPKILRVFDTSHYCTDEEIENYLVEVLPVNKGVWITFVVRKDFSLVLNSASLRYTKGGTISDLADLPDGIYEFKMSVKPNILNINHFYHLRTVDFERKLQAQFVKLIDGKCNLSSSEYNSNKLKLRDIEEYVKAAKWQVEECLDKVKGKELYEFAQKLLQQYTNDCKC